MKIKIECTQQEFASLVRTCDRVSSCSGCALYNVCSADTGIEGAVEVSLVEGGAADG